MRVDDVVLTYDTDLSMPARDVQPTGPASEIVIWIDDAGMELAAGNDGTAVKLARAGRRVFAVDLTRLIPPNKLQIEPA